MEDKDIKILEDMIEKSRDLCEEEFYQLIDVGKIQRISDLLQAYKQDEKVIWEMAIELNNRDFGFDYGIADEDLYDGIIDYFRKRCE